jgi:hypothetical protein
MDVKIADMSLSLAPVCSAAKSSRFPKGDVSWQPYAREEFNCYGSVLNFRYQNIGLVAMGLAYLRKRRGWEIGTEPSVAIVDTGMARSFSTDTLRRGT